MRRFWGGVVGAVLAGLTLTAASCPKPCPTKANLFVGIDPEKPAPGKEVLICPGESVGLAWGTVKATSAEIAPEIGEVELEGLRVVTPAESTSFTLTATGAECNDTDLVNIRVIKEGDTIGVTLDEPPVDKDTGVPADLVWRGSVDPAFVSNRIEVTRVDVVEAGQWPTWNFMHTDVAGQQHFFSGNLGQGTSPAPPFRLAGTYQGTPTNLTAPVAIADFPVGLRLTLRCRQ